MTILLSKLSVLWYSGAVLLILLMPVGLSGQSSIHYSTKNGLPSNHVYEMRQDSDGYMWFATNRGLAKFDGTEFRTFTTKDGLSNNDIWQLESDEEGRLWYLSKSKYQGYIQDDKVYSFITQDSVALFHQFYTDNDNIWLQSHPSTYALQDSLFVPIFTWPWSKPEVEQILDSFEVAEIWTLMIDISRNVIRYIDLNKSLEFDLQGILKKNHRNSDMKPIKFRKENILLMNKVIDDIHVSVSYQGAEITNLESKEVAYFNFKDLIGQEQVDFAKCARVRNEIQVSLPGHLIVFNFDLEILRHIVIPEKIPNLHIYQDRDGNVWIANFGHGVSMIPYAHIRAQRYLENKVVQKIGGINQKVYAGIQNEGFTLLDEAYDMFTEPNFFLNRDISRNDVVYRIKYDQKTNTGFLVSVYGSYMYKNNKYKKIVLTRSDTLLAESTEIGFKDHSWHNNSLYSVNPFGMYISDSINLKPTHYIGKSGLLVLEVYNDHLYTGGSDGLLRVDNTLREPPIHHPLLEIGINFMVNNGDYLLVGTDGRGVYFYNEKEVIHVKSTDDLIVQKIIYQTDGVLWLATQRGVAKVLIDTMDIGNSQIMDTYYESDGLLQDNTNDIYINDSLLYVCSDLGVARINLNDSLYTQLPQLIFEGRKDSLVFKHEDRGQISTSFSVLNFVNQDHYKYWYRLLPEQKEWFSTNTKAINFSNLGPDNYTLEVRVQDQHLNQCIAQQSIIILPAWWQTVWARLGFLALFGLFFMALQYAVKLRIRKKEQAKVEFDKRISSIELQSLRSQMNPHFIHNALNAIQYFIQRNESELSELYLAKFSKLIRMFFEYSRKNIISIEDEVKLITLYLEIEQLRFENKLAIQITVDQEISIEDLYMPSMILQPIVENAVNHGVFHKKKGGAVTVNFEKIDHDRIKVNVTDDGIGINKAREIYASKKNSYQSKSTHVLEERLKLLNVNEDWKISYNIVDRSDISDKTGTKVEFIFKPIIDL